MGAREKIPTEIVLDSCIKRMSLADRSGSLAVILELAKQSGGMVMHSSEGKEVFPDDDVIPDVIKVEVEDPHGFTERAKLLPTVKNARRLDYRAN